MNRAPAALLLTLGALSAQAQITIDIGAQEQQAWSDGQVFNPPETRAWGWALAAQDSSNGVFGTGPAPCDTIVCPPAPTIGGQAGAVARADAGAMNLGVRAWGNGEAHGVQSVAEVEAKDRFVTTGFTTLSFDIRLDLTLSVNPLPGSEGRYVFAIVIGSGDSPSTPFHFRAERRYSSGNTFETMAQVRLNDGATVIDLPQLPSTYALELPVAFSPGSTDVRLMASAFAEGPTGSSFVNVNAYNSAWLGVTGEFTSANGYAYPGLPVPEPHSAGLLVLGGLMLAAWRRRFAAGRG